MNKLRILRDKDFLFNFSSLTRKKIDWTFWKIFYERNNVIVPKKEFRMAIFTTSKEHFWAKFKIVLVRKPGRKFYYFMAKFQVSGFSFQSLNQDIKVVAFPSIFLFQKFKVAVFPSNFLIQFFKVRIFEILP